MIKNLRKTAMLLAAAALLIFTGCNNLVSGVISGDGLNGNGAGLLVSVSNVDDYARLLAPVKEDTANPGTYIYDQLDVDSSIIKGYVLEGSSLSGKTFTPISITPTEIKTGSVVIYNVPKDDWSFTLLALDTDVQGTAAVSGTSNATVDNTKYGNAKPLLKGVASVNVGDTGTPSVTFTLSTYSVTTPGSYNFKIKYTGTATWVDTNKIMYNLYDRKTGVLVKSDYGTTSGETTTSASITAGVAAAKTGIDPGTYVFGVTITEASGATTFVSDIIRIEPGRETNSDFIIGDVLTGVPAAPEGFIAQWIETDMDEDYYTVRFFWEDESTNETSFALAIKEYTNSSTAFNKVTSTASLTAGDYYKLYNYNSVLEATSGDIRYLGGSLYAGSTELVMKFPTGRLFEAQLFAVNSKGYSDGCLRVAASTTSTAFDTSSATTVAENSSPVVNSLYGTGGIKYTGYDATAIAAGAVYKRISLVRTTYLLDGGTLGGVTGVTNATKNYVTYAPYTLNVDGATNDVSMPALLTVDGQTVTLKKNNIDFTEWDYYDSTDGQKVCPGTAPAFLSPEKYKNISVIAVYGVNAANVTISSATVQPQPELILDRITMSSVPENNPSENGTSILTNGTGEVPIGRGSRQLITVSVSAGASTTAYNTFTKFCLWVAGTKIQEIISTSNSCEFAAFNSDRLNAGASTQIMVEASNSYGTASQVILVKCSNAPVNP
ncbi:MAG: hypothetical protein K5786_04710 [Treponema sp.]|nr:hypothetical protein [Treponema sp.]